MPCEEMTARITLNMSPATDASVSMLRLGRMPAFIRRPVAGAPRPGSAASMAAETEADAPASGSCSVRRHRRCSSG